MARPRGNRNWGKSEQLRSVAPNVTSFELVVKEFKLLPDQLVRSVPLRDWARLNKNFKYVPESLLKAWGFKVKSTPDD